jgi:hypothetical protein
MRIRNYDQLILDYGLFLESESIECREMNIQKFRYSIIVEGNYHEIENIESWIKTNFNETEFEKIGYGKIAYDHGYVEYFFDNDKLFFKLEKVVPKIYTTYRNAIPKEIISKSEGWDNQIIYDSIDDEAIII